jgi:FAD/FMN-containing dehydrogenase
MSGILEELIATLPLGAVLGQTQVRQRARSHWDPAAMEALALVRPRSTAEVSAVLKLCSSRGQNIVAHGGLTGVCSADRTSAHDVVVSFELMNKIEEIDTVGRTVTVQAGCTLQALRAAVEREGLYFPLDLGARGSCTVGGNIATNAGGTNVIRFGMMRALVLGLEVVLADGTVITSMNRMLKNNTGYDVKQLFIGSEGTLGIVTRMVLALKEQSASTNTALVAVDEGRHLASLLKLADRRLGGSLSSFEAMWGDYFRAVTEPGWHRSPMAREHPYYVIIEARGVDPAEDVVRFNLVIERALQEGLIVDAVLPKSGTERDHIWAIREDFEALRRHEPLFLYDISLPLRDMLNYVDQVKDSLNRRWPINRFYALGHIGDGNLHFFVAPGTNGDLEEMHAACDESVYLPLRQFNGAVSAEHGIGLEKKMWMSVSRSSAEIELMRVLKRTLDPNNILNRGKVLDV